MFCINFSFLKGTVSRDLYPCFLLDDDNHDYACTSCQYSQQLTATLTPFSPVHMNQKYRDTVLLESVFYMHIYCVFRTQLCNFLIVVFKSSLCGFFFWNRLRLKSSFQWVFFPNCVFFLECFFLYLHVSFQEMLYFCYFSEWFIFHHPQAPPGR